MTLGGEFARARHRLDLSLEELYVRTGISVEWLRAIEASDTTRLPSMIHLRRCLHTFAAEVGLDPDATSARYIAALNRSPLEEFESETRESEAAWDAVVGHARSTWMDEAELYGDAQKEEREPADDLPRRLAIPVRSSSTLLPYAAFMAAALVPFAAGFWILTASYRRTGGSASDAVTSQQTHRPNLPRDAAVAQSAAPVDHERTSPESRVSQQQSKGDLAGWWMLTSQVEGSSVDAYKDLTLGFRLQLDQRGTRVRGHGVKWTENGRALPSRGRTPITVEGTIDGDRLALTFTERGARRTSKGSFDMALASDGSLDGRFSTDAAQSSGRAHAVRMSSQ